jgi:2-keto-4-pentenoate hydratase/2-oxohepta-3-ene-1,7-dioic acid hydratase in catechol pathway
MKPYKLCSYTVGKEPARAGIVIDDAVLDAEQHLHLSSSMLDLLDDWPAAQAVIARLAAAGSGQLPDGLPLDSVRLAAPLLYPGAIYCAGANYADHVAEMARAAGMDKADDLRANGGKPWFFIRPSRACVIGADDVVEIPPGCAKLDWEVELVAVIGKTTRHVSVQDALTRVAGYTVGMDLSARDLSRRANIAQGSPFHYDWLAHKGFQGSCPLGPWITPAAQVPDPQALSIGLKVNGQTMQDSSTSEMIFNVAEQIAHISSLVTLYPGDLVMTGTPAGVGAARKTFLKSGDRVEATVEGLGRLDISIG